jgi:hypothetical protein
MSPEIEREAPKSGELSVSSGQHTFRAAHATISGVIPAPRWASPWWLVFLGLALAEVIALTIRVSRVPPDDDWVAAAALVRAQLESNDAITVAPNWADPLLRLHLGDRMSAKLSGRADLSAFERLWVLSIRGHDAPEAPAREPDFAQVFGRVRVARYDFGPSPVVLDFVDALPSANVDYQAREGLQQCPWKERVPVAGRGGLGFGPMPPRQRFECDPKNPNAWVGSTILEDLSLTPRRCIWQHPLGKNPLGVTFKDVNLGTHLVLYAGLDYHRERDERGAPVTMRVLIDGQETARLVHRDGEGFKRYEVNTTSAQKRNANARGEVRFEVTTSNRRDRWFCWSGTVQDARRREAP